MKWTLWIFLTVYCPGIRSHKWYWLLSLPDTSGQFSHPFGSCGSHKYPLIRKGSHKWISALAKVIKLLCQKRMFVYRLSWAKYCSILLFKMWRHIQNLCLASKTVLVGFMATWKVSWLCLIVVHLKDVPRGEDRNARGNTTRNVKGKGDPAKAETGRVLLL